MGLLHNTARWRRKAADQKRREPLCRMHMAQGRVVAGTVADHIEPHRDDPDKFWNGALQTLCAECHNSVKQRLEKSGTMAGCGEDGTPLDPKHHWNQ
jgi:5-methylcytosine-specific restriction protein A